MKGKNKQTITYRIHNPNNREDTLKMIKEVYMDSCLDKIEKEINKLSTNTSNSRALAI